MYNVQLYLYIYYVIDAFFLYMAFYVKLNLLF